MNVSVPYEARAAFFCLEPGPTLFGRSRRLWDLRLPEPEPPKKVAAPQHCQAVPHPPSPEKNLLCGTAGNIVLLHIIVIDLSYRVFQMIKHTCLLARAVLPDR